MSYARLYSNGCFVSISSFICSPFIVTDESHLLLQSPLTVEDIENRGFKVHDPRVSWLTGQWTVDIVQYLDQWLTSICAASRPSHYHLIWQPHSCFLICLGLMIMTCPGKSPYVALSTLYTSYLQMDCLDRRHFIIHVKLLKQVCVSPNKNKKKHQCFARKKYFRYCM